MEVKKVQEPVSVPTLTMLTVLLPAPQVYGQKANRVTVFDDYGMGSVWPNENQGKP